VPDFDLNPVRDFARNRLPGRSDEGSRSGSNLRGAGSKLSAAAAAAAPARRAVSGGARTLSGSAQALSGGAQALTGGVQALTGGARGGARSMSTRARGGGQAIKTRARAGARAVSTGLRVGHSAAEFVVNVSPRPPKARRGAGRGGALRRAPALAAAVIAGASAEYLLDPVDGKRRRKTLQDQALARVRRLLRRGGQQARYAEGKVEGVVHSATPTSGSASAATPTADDQTLANRVRTEIFRRPDAPKGDVNVTAVDGVVHLRGEVSVSAEIERLVTDARGVAGVRAVENLLHVPGVPAPTGGRA
jgi:osmotically-inducible protein OsmY